MKCDLHIHSSLSPDSGMEPEEIAACKKSYTGQYLKKYLMPGK